jgi:hypothetical protein
VTPGFELPQPDDLTPVPGMSFRPQYADSKQNTTAARPFHGMSENQKNSQKMRAENGLAMTAPRA